MQCFSITNNIWIIRKTENRRNTDLIQLDIKRECIKIKQYAQLKCLNGYANEQRVIILY